MDLILSMFCLAIFLVLMGKRRYYNPTDHRGVDIEAASAEGPMRTSSSEHSSSPGRREGRRRNRRQPHFTEDESIPQIWLVCPCRNCARSPKPHTRLYSTVKLHLRQHLMGEKYKVITLKRVFENGFCICYPSPLSYIWLPT
jgi:hypothetical protein